MRSIIPAIRSAIPRELIREHGLRQKDVAIYLGVTQTAVSKYIKHIRGTALGIEGVQEIQPLIDEIVLSLANGSMSKYELVTKFCEACETLRRKGLMCELCKINDPTVEIENCSVCRL